MKDDLRQINKEEDRLQRELIQIHKKNLNKHNEIVTKNNIDTQISNTEDLVRKLVNAPKSERSSNQKMKKGPAKPGKEDDPLEEQIEESLENLDNLLEGLKKGSKE